MWSDERVANLSYIHTTMYVFIKTLYKDMHNFICIHAHMYTHTEMVYGDVFPIMATGEFPRTNHNFHLLYGKHISLLMH